MKLKLFLLTASAMVLATSCSSDEVVNDAQSNNAIKFSVTANQASRAASYYCDNAKPAQFNVWAKVDGATYFSNESFASTDLTSWKNEGAERYWPETQVINFFAVKHLADKDVEGAFIKGEPFAVVSWNTEVPTIGMTIKEKASQQQDLLYAYTEAQRKGDDGATKNFANGVAKLNFRHALSQVVFQAKNANEKIFVEINEVKVCEVNSKGTFRFELEKDGKANVTDNAYVNHTQASKTIEGGLGSWTVHTLATFDTEVFDNVNVKGDGKVVNLTNNRFVSDNHDAGVPAHTLLLLPQSIAKGSIEKGEGAAKITGAYFLVYCKIRNVAAQDGNVADNDVYLWGDKDNYKAIAIPVNQNEAAYTWEQGKKYIYTFNFTTNGHGGFDPDSGEDVLIPISFTVTVDDFTEVSAGTVDIDK